MNVDLTIPEIPLEVYSLAHEEPDLTYHTRAEELWILVCSEVLDEMHLGRSHHNNATYDKGCHGPLCQKAAREHPKRRRAAVSALALRDERIYDPVLEYFHTVLKYRIRKQQQALLKECVDQ